MKHFGADDFAELFKNLSIESSSKEKVKKFGHSLRRLEMEQA